MSGSESVEHGADLRVGEAELLGQAEAGCSLSGDWTRCRVNCRRQGHDCESSAKRDAGDHFELIEIECLLELRGQEH